MEIKMGTAVWSDGDMELILYNNPNTGRCTIWVGYQQSRMIELDISTAIIMVIHDGQGLLGDVIRLNLMHMTDETEENISVVESIVLWVEESLTDAVKFWDMSFHS